MVLETEIRPTVIDPIEELYWQMEQEASSGFAGAALVTRTARNMIFHAQVARKHAEPGYKIDTREDKIDFEKMGNADYAMRYAEKLRSELSHMAEQQSTNLPMKAGQIINTLRPIYAHTPPTLIK